MNEVRLILNLYDILDQSLDSNTIDCIDRLEHTELAESIMVWIDSYEAQYLNFNSY